MSGERGQGPNPDELTPEAKRLVREALAEVATGIEWEGSDEDLTPEDIARLTGSLEVAKALASRLKVEE